MSGPRAGDGPSNIGEGLRSIADGVLRRLLPAVQTGLVALRLGTLAGVATEGPGRDGRVTV